MFILKSRGLINNIHATSCLTILWSLVFFDTPYHICKYRIHTCSWLLQTSQAVPSAFSLEKKEWRWEFLAIQGHCVSYTQKDLPQLKKYYLKPVKRREKMHRASGVIAWCQPCARALAMGGELPSLCRGMGPGWAGQLGLPPASPQRRKHWLVLGRRSIFSVDFPTDSALFRHFRLFCSTLCHLRNASALPPSPVCRGKQWSQERLVGGRWESEQKKKVVFFQKLKKRRKTQESASDRFVSLLNSA